MVFCTKKLLSLFKTSIPKRKSTSTYPLWSAYRRLKAWNWRLNWAVKINWSSEISFEDVSFYFQWYLALRCSVRRHNGRFKSNALARADIRAQQLRFISVKSLFFLSLLESSEDVSLTFSFCLLGIYQTKQCPKHFSRSNLWRRARALYVAAMNSNFRARNSLNILQDFPPSTSPYPVNFNTLA